MKLGLSPDEIIEDAIRKRVRRAQPGAVTAAAKAGMNAISWDVFCAQGIPRGNTIWYAWGLMDERESVAYPDGGMVSYEYDGNRRLTRATAGADVTEYSYNSAGLLVSARLPNKQSTVY